MTYSETKFREYLKRYLGDPKAYIRKLPDLKQGSRCPPGMPDYVTISKGITRWFEVKLSHTKTTFNLNDISESQYIEFDKMHNGGADIFIAVYIGKELFIIPYKDIWVEKFLGNTTSLNLSELNRWRA